MAIIKASDPVYARFRLPDLALAEQFLIDFGLVPVGRIEDTSYFRGTDRHPYCYVVEKGEAHFLGFGLLAKSRSDLEVLAAATGQKIELIFGPGGGSRVRLREPNGYEVDIVHGMADVSPIEVVRQQSNSAAHPFARPNELFRLAVGQPTPVRGLAHVVLGSPRPAETIEWFSDTLGLIHSDKIVSSSERTLMGAFMRVDDGDRLVDHHALFVMKAETVGLQHVSFEAQDIEAVLHDHHYLKSLGRYQHRWGIGRHLLGSQVFDYWSDPFGYSHEHWADTDRLDADAPTGVHDITEGLVNQWGEPATPLFRGGMKP